MSVLPTARSLAHLRKQGYKAQVVERFNHHAKIRVDLYGCIDILGIRDSEILGVQTTSGSNFSARRSKSLALPELRAWLEAGGRFVLHGWAKQGPRGARKLWTLREEEITLESLG